jgi:hypothetical protein
MPTSPATSTAASARGLRQALKQQLELRVAVGQARQRKIRTGGRTHPSSISLRSKTIRGSTRIRDLLIASIRGSFLIVACCRS